MFQFEDAKKIDPYLFPHKLQRDKDERFAKFEKHKEGVAKAYGTIKLQPLKAQQNNDKTGPQPVWSKGSPTATTAAPKPVHGEYYILLQYFGRTQHVG